MGLSKRVIFKWEGIDLTLVAYISVCIPSFNLIGITAVSQRREIAGLVRKAPVATLKAASCILSSSRNLLLRAEPYTILA